MWGFGHTRRLEALEEDFKNLKRDFQALELDWTQVYDKLRQAMGRIVKSRAIIEQKEKGEEPPPVQTGSPGRLLTEHQLEIQQRILRRRAGG